jgi:diacylglycerol kinase (ATP)
MLKIKLIINFSAGKIQNNLLSIKKLINKLNSNKILAEIISTTSDESDKDMILSDLETKDAVIVCGGDGTLNKVITYMIKSDICKPILFIPGGTANVFYLEKNLSSNIDKAIHTLLTGKKIKTDIGFVEHEAGMNYFLLMVGIGIDSNAVKEVDVTIKNLLGKTSYLFAGVKNFITYKPKQIELEFNDKKIRDVHTVIISNSRLYGGNIELFPEADMHDGLLDMCVFNAENNVVLFKNIVNIQYGKHINQPDVEYNKIKSAIIKSTNNIKMPFQIDGEFVGYLPIKVGILQEKIEFILP